MPIFLNGLFLSFYRSVGKDAQLLGPFKDFNFFIGSNNAGKSTVLTFLDRYLPRGQKFPKIDFLERHSGPATGEPRAGHAFLRSDFFQQAAANITDHRAAHFKEYLAAILDVLSEPNGLLFAISSVPPDRWTFLRREKFTQAKLTERSWNLVWSMVRGGSGGNMRIWQEQTLSWLEESLQNPQFPKVALVPAIRQVGKLNEEFSDYSGRGLIDQLAQIQSPDHDRLADREKFKKINAFLQSVTDSADARIEIPHNRAHVLVEMNNKVHPLSSLGTGIHEVVMLAAFCTLSEQEIVCIEEPEIHLHPLLQRKFIAYLKGNTSNQYFIATHSAAFIDTPDAAIFHVANDGIATTIAETALRSEKLRVCTDLGYRASDILQANCVIWVEGPSDRIYLNHWIQFVEPSLIEGIHYSIMFYGGRLLSHLSANDKEISEFIDLRALNQNLAIVIDSDRASAHSKITATKERIVSEFSAPSFAWITKGREVENYIDHQTLQAAVKETHPEIYGSILASGSYDHALYFERLGRSKSGEDGIQRVIDKVKVARIVCEKPANLNVLDLKTKVSELVDFVKRANAH